MTFVSSFRPHSESAEYRLNQCRAIASWTDKADNIVLFGSHEPDLAVRNVTFIKPNAAWPSIKEMLRFCAMSFDAACILNADVFLGGEFWLAWGGWAVSHGTCATSRRYEYDPAKFPASLQLAKVVDMGFDFFMATQVLWKKAAAECPESMFIGHSLWDNWMLGFFSVHAKKFFYDLTRYRFVFHPKHGGRRQAMPVHIESPYLQHHGWGRRL